ncbi:DUF6958 family protein [Loktanella agnita]|uniref:DUF6958 family protein n=1 Tax=Loktanella agnita TaxID=287097 RepID=UPI003988320A
MTQAADKIEVENINTPGRTERVDKAKYTAMKTAYLAALPDTSPGFTAAEAKAALLPLLSEDVFPGGAKAGWWMKCVQLDLEAKEIVKREKCSPLRFHKM